MAYTKKTLAEIKNNIIINLITNVDEINDANVGSVLDVLVDSLSTEFEEQYNDLDIIYNGTRIETATEDDLDNLGAIVGVTRSAGALAEGNVTFIRSSPATSNFTISSGTIISTQPNIGEEVYQFTTNADGIFQTSIVDETRTFIDGIYQYKFDERLVDSITSLTGTGGPFVENTDYSLSEDYSGIIIDTSTFELLDDCEVTTGWSAVGADTGATATSATHYQGSNSIDMTKSGSTITTFGYDKTLGAPVDLEDVAFEFLSLYTSTSLLTDLTEVKLWVGSGGSTSHSYEFTFTSFTADDWNRLIMDITNVDTIINGNPQIDAINYLKIQVTVDNSTDTVTTGNCLMDFWFGADKVDYEGDIVLWDRTATTPTDSTTVTYTYVPLSLDITVTGENVGDEYNVAKNKIIYKVSNLPNVDTLTNYITFTGGIDEEDDSDYRERIKTASDLANKATSAAIKANVEALAYVKSATVDDMPEEVTVDETHTFSSTTDKYSLCNKVPIDDANLDVEGTLAATPGHTFVKTTDYILNDDGDIEFGQGGSDPDNGTVTYTDYHYNKLGHFDLLVAGELGSLTTTQITAITAVVDETISVGVTYTIAQPTYTSIDVTVTLTIDASYTSSTVKDLAETAIEDYIKDLEIGDDVLLAGVINVVMDIEGVDNMVVNDIGGGGSVDYTIASSEIAIPGVILIS